MESNREKKYKVTREKNTKMKKKTTHLMEIDHAPQRASSLTVSFDLKHVLKSSDSLESWVFWEFEESSLRNQ